MKKIALLQVTFLFSITLFAQDYKALGDAKAAEGDYSGAAAYYEMGMEHDDECAFKFFKLIYEKKIEPYYTDHLYLLILPLAEKGNAEAQYYLGSMYDLGYGVEKSEEEAVAWMKKSAEQGYQEAINFMKIWEIQHAPPIVVLDTIPAIIPDTIAVDIQQQLIPELGEPMAPMVRTAKVSSGTKVKTTFGLKAGINFANIGGTDFSPSMKTGFHLGALTRIRFGYRDEKSPGIFALQPELLYSQQGFKIEGTSSNFSYLAIPVMCKLYLLNLNGLNFEAGPYFSYLFSVSPESISIKGPQFVVSELKGGQDVGLCLGVGFDTVIGFTIGARYMLGLNELASNLQGKNRVISVSVGWNF